MEDGFVTKAKRCPDAACLKEAGRDLNFKGKPWRSVSEAGKGSIKILVEPRLKRIPSPRGSKTRRLGATIRNGKTRKAA